MRNRSKFALAGVLVLALGIGTPAAANAVGESGTKTCGGTTPYSWVRSYATGYVTQKAPGGSIFNHVNGTTWKTRVNQGINGGGAWYANTDGAMDDPGTYAYCSNFS